MTSPFNRTAAAPATAPASPFGQQAAPAPAVSTPAATPAGRFATKRDRPDKFPTALDLMPSEVKGTNGALVIVRVERAQRDLKGQNGNYDAFDSKVWILDAPQGLPPHVLEAGEERHGAWYLPEMRWSGAGLVRDLEDPLAERILFVGRVGAYENQFKRPSPEFNATTEAEYAQAEAYVNAHPEVDFPKVPTSSFARPAA